MGTAAFKQRSIECSDELLQADNVHVKRTKGKLNSNKTSSKTWWKLSELLMYRAKRISGIPPLKDGKAWVLTAGKKADVLAKRFDAKNKLIPFACNPDLDMLHNQGVMGPFLPIRHHKVQSELKKLQNVATGPDHLSAVV